MTDELFGRRLPTQIAEYPELRNFQECVDIAPHLQKRQGNDFEQYLQNLFTSSASSSGETKLRHLRQLAAIRYYLKHLLIRFSTEWKSRTTDSNYRTLINDLEPIQRASGERVIFVTFNYDTLLEDRLQQALPNIKIRSVDDYVSSDWPIFKLHGSVNWGRVINTQSLIMAGVDVVGDTLSKMPLLDLDRLLISKSPLEVSDGFAFDPGGSGLASVTPGSPLRLVLFPALAIPMLNKDDFELPRDQLNMLTKMIPHVSKVVSIGWRGAEDKFLDLLSKHLRRDTDVLAVSRDSNGANKVIERFGKARVPMKRHEIATGGFTSSLAQIAQFVSKGPPAT